MKIANLLCLPNIQTIFHSIGSFFFIAFCLFPSSRALGGFFQVADRRYGTFGSQTAVRSQIDLAFNSLENNVNSKISDVDTKTFFASSANAMVVAGSGLGTNYSTPTKVGVLGVGLGVAIDHSGPLTTSKPDPKDFQGAGGQMGFMLGLNGNTLLPRPFAGIDLDKLRLYFLYLKQEITENEINIHYDTYGFTAQYRWLDPAALGFGFLSWNGLESSIGFKQSRLKFIYTNNFNESSTENISVLNQNVSTTVGFRGPLSVGGDFQLLTVPIELSTSLRLFYVLNLFGGFGADFVAGYAKSIASVTGEVEVTSTNNLLGDVGASADLDMGSDASPKFMGQKTFLGLELQAGIFSVFVQATKRLSSNITGATAGMKLYW